MDEIKNTGASPEENDPSQNEKKEVEAEKEADFEDNAPPSVPPQYQSERVRPPHSSYSREGFNPPPPPPPFGDHGFSHTGEYRYTPPFADDKRPPFNGFDEGKKKKGKTVRTFSTTALVLILVGTILLSFAAGMCGALFINGGFGMGEKTENVFGNNAGNASGNKNDASEKTESSSNPPLVIEKVEGNSSSSSLTGSFDLTDVCAAVSPCVVEVTTEFNKTYYGYYQYVEEGAGSGVIISADGYILTNAHVITDRDSGKLADTITIRLNNSEEYTARIIGSDTDSDIALIKIDGEGFSYATVGDSDSLRVGEQIIAVGNPLGELGGTVTCGIVSATNREISVENNKMTLIQIDAAINPGNSGGGLFNTSGELIGIVNAKTTDVTVEGLGFAIPVNEAINVAEELQSHGYVTGKTYIGVGLADVTSAFDAYYYFGSDATGVFVTSVQEGYNDDVLKYGDRITAIDDTEVTSTAEVKEIINESKVGDVLIFTVSRGKKLVDVEVVCYEYVPEGSVSFEDQ